MEEQYNRRKQCIIIFILILTMLEIVWLIFAETLFVYKIIALFLLFGILSAVCFLLYLTSRAVDNFSEMITGLLDNIITRKELISMNPNQETYLSKCEAKLEKLHELMLYERSAGAKDKEEMKALISDISHQVRTPLSNMRMLVNTLGRQDITQGEQDRFWQQLVSQMDKIEFLMQSLIKASRLESGVIDIYRKEQRIFDTIAQALGDIYIEAEKKKIEITVDCQEDLFVYHDRKWTEEALFNMLDNAVKYTPEYGMIEIIVSAQVIYTEIRISDNGIGVSPEHYEDIFKRFYREAKVHDYNGIGVGLYLARQIIEMQNGYITVGRREGKEMGAVFKIYLPNKEV